MSVAQEARFKAGRTCFEGASKDGGERVKALRRRDGERRGRAAACDLLTIEVGGARSVYGRSNYTVLTCDSRFPSSRPRTQALHIVKDSVKTAKSRKQNGSCQDEDNQEGFSCPHREVVRTNPGSIASFWLTRTCSSYPRLTLDFHTNKRIIDEVVRHNVWKYMFCSSD